MEKPADNLGAGIQGPSLPQLPTSKRQVGLALLISAILAMLLWLSFDRLTSQAQLPAWFARYAANDLCVGIFFAFVGAAIYATMQLAGARSSQRALAGEIGFGAGLIAVVTGRSRTPSDALLPVSRFVASREAAAHGAWRDQIALDRERLASRLMAPCQYAVWALPLLGFIGTVIGIARSIAGLTVVAQSPDQMAEGLGSVLQGLSFAFDTTFVGLICVLPLMALMLLLRSAIDSENSAYNVVLMASIEETTA